MKTITVFWSWQSDSDAAITRNHIQYCLDKATRQIVKEEPLLIEIDKDTKGVGGTPNISETILKKIVESDIFVWDATLSTKSPRLAPNPNVLFELGFAVAVLGWERVIGVITEYGKAPNLHELIVSYTTSSVLCDMELDDLLDIAV